MRARRNADVPLKKDRKHAGKAFTTVVGCDVRVSPASYRGHLQRGKTGAHSIGAVRRRSRAHSPPRTYSEAAGRGGVTRSHHGPLLRLPSAKSPISPLQPHSVSQSHPPEAEAEARPRMFSILPTAGPTSSDGGGSRYLRRMSAAFGSALSVLSAPFGGREPSRTSPVRASASEHGRAPPAAGKKRRRSTPSRAPEALTLHAVGRSLSGSAVSGSTPAISGHGSETQPEVSAELPNTRPSPEATARKQCKRLGLEVSSVSAKTSMPHRVPQSITKPGRLAALAGLVSHCPKREAAQEHVERIQRWYIEMASACSINVAAVESSAKLRRLRTPGPGATFRSRDVQPSLQSPARLVRAVVEANTRVTAVQDAICSAVHTAVLGLPPSPHEDLRCASGRSSSEQLTFLASLLREDCDKLATIASANCLFQAVYERVGLLQHYNCDEDGRAGVGDLSGFDTHVQEVLDAARADQPAAFLRRLSAAVGGDEAHAPLSSLIRDVRAHLLRMSAMSVPAASELASGIDFGSPPRWARSKRRRVQTARPSTAGQDPHRDRASWLNPTITRPLTPHVQRSVDARIRPPEGMLPPHPGGNGGAQQLPVEARCDVQLVLDEGSAKHWTLMMFLRNPSWQAVEVLRCQLEVSMRAPPSMVWTESGAMHVLKTREQELNVLLPPMAPGKPSEIHYAIRVDCPAMHEEHGHTRSERDAIRRRGSRPAGGSSPGAPAASLLSHTLRPTLLVSGAFVCRVRVTGSSGWGTWTVPISSTQILQ